jgi:hypothetical protein
MSNKKYDVLIELFNDKQYEEPKPTLIERKPDLNFYDVLKSSYNDKPTNQFKKSGYILDEELSTRNNQVYVRPKRKKLLMVTTGTRLSEGVDLYHDAMSTVGLKTSRYTEAKNILEKARKKHGIRRAHLAGHSLGYMVSNSIAEPHDEVIGYNGALGIPTFHKSKTKKIFHVKDENDLITIAKATKIIKSKDGPRLGNMGGHKLKNLFNTPYGNKDIFRVHNEL